MLTLEEILKVAAQREQMERVGRMSDDQRENEVSKYAYSDVTHEENAFLLKLSEMQNAGATDGNIQQLVLNEIRRSKASVTAINVKLKALWLSEQNQRLENIDLLEMFGAAKAKIKIERLTAANAGLHDLLKRLMSEVSPYCRPSMVDYDVFPVFKEAVDLIENSKNHKT